MPDVVVLDFGGEEGVELADEAAAERQIDGLETEVVVRLYVETQPARDILRVTCRVRERESGRLGIGLHAADTARRLARVNRECERADVQNRGTPSDQPHIYPLRHLTPPGLLPGGGDKIVDDVWRNQNEQITPVLLLRSK